jgi:hypothetical protein
MNLACFNDKHRQYNEILKKIRVKKIPRFNTGGRLCICLIEFRNMIEIDYVIRAVLKMYPCDYEIGLAVVYGNKNRDLVESLYSDYKNIQLIHKDVDNLNRGTYSALLKMPQFYEQFINWSHVLIYQTDALMFRKIPDFYFNYDYIGAPWIEKNHWTKYNAGNGGFSLRNVKSCIKICECFRNTPYEKIPRGNEDGYFCNSDDFVYPKANSYEHRHFAVERVKCMQPVGCHQIYHGGAYSGEEWDSFLNFMRHVLLDEDNDFELEEIKTPQDVIQQTKIELEINEINEPSKKKETNEKNKNTKNTQNKLKPLLKEGQLAIEHLEKTQQEIGPFKAFLNNQYTNNWRVDCIRDYEILICRSESPDSVVETFKIDKSDQAHLHKKQEGGYYFKTEKHFYLVFHPGYPNGTQSYADVRAPWENAISNKCKIPPGGAVLFRTEIAKDEFKELPLSKKIARPQPNPASIKKVNTSNDNLNEKQLIEKYNLQTIEHNILIFDLFSGVGYYNQLFSFEQAVYMANISGRYLIVNIRHPLSACGRPNRDYGPLTDYLQDTYKKYVKGMQVRLYEDSVNTSLNELKLPSKMSSCVIVDDEFDLKDAAVKEFIHYRMPLKMKDFGLMDKNKKIVTFKKSNASRVFYNMYTSTSNYKIMNKICFEMSKYNDTIMEICKMVRPNIHNQYIGIHLRLGDWHKSKEHINSNSDKIFNNINNWLIKNNKYNFPIYVLLDREDSDVVVKLKKNWNLINVESFITNKIKEELGKKYKNTIVAEFIIQKYILENATYFIGSQGSTVSVHTNYINYLNAKPYDMYTHSNNINYNSNTLTINKMDNKNHGWSKRGYSGGHPTSWSFFFEDNIFVQ